MNSLNNTNITKDVIVDYLRDEIMNGRLTNENNLNQEYLAKALGISRMPLREAFQILELEGTLIRLSNRKVMINSLSVENANHSFRLVFAIESEIIGQAMKQKADIKSLKNVAQQYKKAVGQPDSSQDLVNLELQFHVALSQLLENSYFEGVLLQALKPYCFFTIQNCTINYQYHSDLFEKLIISIEEDSIDNSNSLLEEYLNSLYESVKITLPNSDDTSVVNYKDDTIE